MPGATILELLCYLFLVSLVGTLLSHVVVLTHRSLGRYNQRLSSEIGLCAALDVLRRDLFSAPADAHAWKKISTTDIVWDQGEVCIGWQLEHEKLFRYEGAYDEHRHVWGKRTKNLIAKGLTSVDFRMREEQGAIRYCEVSLKEALLSDEMYACVAARNRELA